MTPEERAAIRLTIEHADEQRLWDRRHPTTDDIDPAVMERYNATMRGDRLPQTVATGGAFARALNEEIARAFNEEHPIFRWNDGVQREAELREQRPTLSRAAHIDRHCTCLKHDGRRIMSDMECPMYNLHR